MKLRNLILTSALMFSSGDIYSVPKGGISPSHTLKEHIESYGDNLLNLNQTPDDEKYIELVPKKVGDKMPIIPSKKYFASTGLFSENKKTHERREIGIIKSYDRNNDKIPYLEFVIRHCDNQDSVKEIAAFVPEYKLFYGDLNRDGIIDIVSDEYDSILGVELPMITSKCKEIEEGIAKSYSN